MMPRLASSILALLAGFVLLGSPATASPLRTPYLVADETRFWLGAYPERFGVASTLPLPAGDLTAIANEAVCYYDDHPAIVAGLVPFGGPIIVEFWHLTEGQMATGSQSPELAAVVLEMIEPVQRVALPKVVCGERI